MLQVARDILKHYGVKYSRQRALVLSLLMDAKQPLTADALYDLGRQEEASLNLSTIYRILSAFEDNGIAVKTHLEIDNKALYELKREEHKHHIICVGCQKITELPGCPLHGYERDLQEKMGYTITSHKLVMYGYCPECTLS